ncbi:hypothetical protein E4U41_001727 [Claviceps citrina]|nr:hypothetical protein E4U41_001727 [Claviceps citrina]
MTSSVIAWGLPTQDRRGMGKTERRSDMKCARQDEAPALRVLSVAVFVAASSQPSHRPEFPD